GPRPAPPREPEDLRPDRQRRLPQVAGPAGPVRRRRSRRGRLRGEWVMRYPWRRLLMLLLMGTAGLVAWLPGPARAVGEGGDEPEPRRLPARWRDDPAEYRRLKDEWKAFQK